MYCTKPKGMIELEDYNWFPRFFRNFQTDYIGFVVKTFRVYSPFMKYLNALQLPPKHLTDLCSGSGEPAMHIFKKTNCFTTLQLTDKFPNVLNRDEANITYIQQSVDVISMEFEKNTYYTMFNAFHHFSDENKLKILKNASDAGAKIFIVEILEPTVWCFFKVLVATTLGTLLLTPFVYPFSIKRLFFTYIIPISIITITYDGLVSVLKSRSQQQYKNLLTKVVPSVYVFRIPNPFTPLTIIQQL